MAHLVRLIGAVLLMLGAPAWAAFPAVSDPNMTQSDGFEYRMMVTSTNQWIGYKPGRDAVCKEWIAATAPSQSPTYTLQFVSTSGTGALDNKCNFTRTTVATGAQTSVQGNMDRQGGSCPAGSYVNSSGACVTSNMTCSANATLSGSSCTCNAGFDQLNGACVPHQDCFDLKGQSAGTWWKDQGDNNGLPAKVGFNVCDKYNTAGGGLCVVQVPDRGDTLCVQVDGGWWRCQGTGYYTGTMAPDAAKCSLATGGSGDSANDPLPSTPPVTGSNPPKAPDSPAPNTAAPAPCAAGQAPGTINGVSVCRPAGETGPTAGAAPGSGSQTVNNSDGSSTTSTTSGTTKCENGTCTTTGTTTNVTVNANGNTTCPAGQTVGSTTVSGQTRTTCTSSSTSTGSTSQQEFCSKNKDSKQCGGDGAGSSFGGDCAAGFKAVSDDAVLNAMAEEQYRRNCQVFATTGDVQTEIAAEMAKTGNQTGDNPNNGTVNIGPGNIDTSDALGGGSCNLNKTIEVRGYSATLPFGDMLCDPLAMFGNLLVAVAMLLAGRIITRG